MASQREMKILGAALDNDSRVNALLKERAAIYRRLAEMNETPNENHDEEIANLVARRRDITDLINRS